MFIDDTDHDLNVFDPSSGTFDRLIYRLVIDDIRLEQTVCPHAVDVYQTETSVFADDDRNLRDVHTQLDGFLYSFDLRIAEENRR